MANPMFHLFVAVLGVVALWLLFEVVVKFLFDNPKSKETSNGTPSIERRPVEEHFERRS